MAPVIRDTTIINLFVFWVWESVAWCSRNFGLDQRRFSWRYDRVSTLAIVSALVFAEENGKDIRCED